MAIAELFLTEGIKSVFKVVTGIIEEYWKTPDPLRKYLYHIFDDFTKLETYIDQLVLFVDDYEQNNGGRSGKELKEIIDGVTECIENLEKATKFIKLQYSVYKDIHDVRMINDFCIVEAGYLSAAFSTRSRRTMTVEDKRIALDGLRKVVLQLRGKIAEFIRETYKASDRPDGR